MDKVVSCTGDVALTRQGRIFFLNQNYETNGDANIIWLEAKLPPGCVVMADEEISSDNVLYAPREDMANLAAYWLLKYRDTPKIRRFISRIGVDIADIDEKHEIKEIREKLYKRGARRFVAFVLRLATRGIVKL